MGAVVSPEGRALHDEVFVGNAVRGSLQEAVQVQALAGSESVENAARLQHVGVGQVGGWAVAGLGAVYDHQQPVVGQSGLAAA